MGKMNILITIILLENAEFSLKNSLQIMDKKNGLSYIIMEEEMENQSI
jgi:hypothetical protein